MDTLENMRMFVRVTETGSFTKAANLASVSTAHVSRAITDLESHLHTRLLQRTTRRVTLTGAGERYLQRCEHILAHVELAETEAAGAGTRPSGKLKVHATASVGQHHLARLIARYSKRFPEVLIELVLSQNVPNIVNEGIDVSVVMTRDLVDSNLVSQRIGSVQTILCASPQYLSRRGTPARLADLSQHTCLQLMLPDVPPGEWQFEDVSEPVFCHMRPAPLTVNVAEALVETIREGMGIGPLPISVALPGLRDGSLVRVLPEHRLRECNIYAIYASRRYLDAKIRTFVEFARDQVPLALADENRELLSSENTPLAQPVI
ncbi:MULTISPECIES: LysR family transcriptional regulator [Paraburkholderia]|jgi:DNA-binding transcriptional LysR family regulator|uniref:DNA-binding transcriptional regulator, LysR family n=1 Tax=Paraburkholderia phenazinium TaxID=60549 RepID=A0A1N6K0A1_9BURK|nr:LysR family transcriptional regulator [Paraburkholderia phenazinium]SIO42020.1 DNA-binding transcriptional regulator, LysR family [Paraburkholderia phenazinium]SIO50015.1 DNA-binding transcriptional regulator, LysR family [Paraburkholderia phenazinium]